MVDYKLSSTSFGIDATDLKTTGVSIRSRSRRSSEQDGKHGSLGGKDRDLAMRKRKVKGTEHGWCASDQGAVEKDGHGQMEEKEREEKKRENNGQGGSGGVEEGRGHNDTNTSRSGSRNKRLKQDTVSSSSSGSFGDEDESHFRQLKENYKATLMGACPRACQLPGLPGVQDLSRGLNPELQNFYSGAVGQESLEKTGKTSSRVVQVGKEMKLRGGIIEQQRDQDVGLEERGKKRKRKRSGGEKRKKRRHHEEPEAMTGVEIRGKDSNIEQVIHEGNLLEIQRSRVEGNSMDEEHERKKMSTTVLEGTAAGSDLTKRSTKLCELCLAQGQPGEGMLGISSAAERKHLPKACCIVRDASVQVTELQQITKRIKHTSPAMLESSDEGTDTQFNTSPGKPSNDKDAGSQQQHKSQEAAQIPQLYQLPAPGVKPWRTLLLFQRMEKLSRDQRRGKFNCISENIKQGPVYASIMDLTSSGEILLLLVHWLQCSAVGQDKQELEASNTNLAHAWTLIEYVLREDKNVLEQTKQEVEFEKCIVPRIAEWEEVQKRKEGMCGVIARLWGKSWREDCVAELKAVGRKGEVSWSEPLLNKLKELATLAARRGIEREETWGMILNIALEKILHDKKKKKKIKVVIDDLDEAARKIIKRSSETQLNCGCPFSLRGIVPNLPTPRKCGALMPRRDAVELLKTVHVRLPNSQRSFDLLCHSHLRRLASGTFGLLNNTTPHDILVERINCVFNNLGEEGENPHYEKNPQWFRKPFRPTSDTTSPDNEHVELGLYKYQVTNPNSITHAFSNTPTMTGLSSFIFDRETIFTRFSSPGKFQEFLEHGTVRIPGLFAHLKPEIIEQEFNMYCHHFQPPPGTKPMGWLRIMYHSLTQQAIRQDPIVYALHCAAREDGCWRFISYPYYTKSTSPTGEKTGFFHFDLNVSEYLSTGKSKHVVQSAVTLLSNETPKGCTMLIPGFHRHIQQWWSRHPDAPRGGETTNIIPGKTYTKQDEWDFGPFIPYPCKAGELRLTRPDIPHGSTPVSKDTRRVVFPWLIGIRDDHETLDVDTTETWSQLALCHRDLIACKKSTSGRSASAYGRPEGKFAAAVRMGSTSFIGDALVGRRRWDDVEVVRERDLLLGEWSNEMDVRKWVEEVRERIKREFERCWEVVRMVERGEFGGNAYFRQKE